jgi:hypothetical protein
MLEDVTPYSALKVRRRFGGAFAWKAGSNHALLDLIFDPEDGGDMFLHNVG